MTESDDQGGIDMWGNPTYRGNVFAITTASYRQMAGRRRNAGLRSMRVIRLDDAICGTLIQGNIFQRCSAGKLGFGGVQIHGGKDNVVENNLFADCTAMVSCSPWDDARWRAFVKSAMNRREIDRDLYLERYSELATLLDNANLNHVRNNRPSLPGTLPSGASKNLDATNNIRLPTRTLPSSPTIRCSASLASNGFR